MSWVIGKVELGADKVPKSISILETRKITTIPIPSANPLHIDLGRERKLYRLEGVLSGDNEKELVLIPLEEQFSNDNYQPIRVVAPYNYGGYYLVLRFEHKHKVYKFFTWRLEMIKIGTTASHTNKPEVTVEAVTNDWGI